MKQQPLKYVLVRHTAYSVAGIKTFENAVELRAIYPDERMLKMLQKASVAIFDTFTEVSKKEDEYNYPASTSSMIPAAQGKFITLEKGDFKEELFIPLTLVANRYR